MSTSTTQLKPISSIGSHRLAWSIATGLPLEHRYIDSIQGLIRLLLQNDGVIALTRASGAHQLGLTQQQFRDLAAWAVSSSWITVLHELPNIGKVYGLGSTWHQVDWADVEQLAKAEHNRTQPKVKRQLLRAAIAIRDGDAVGSPDPTPGSQSVPQTRHVGSPDPTDPTKPAAPQRVSSPNTTTDTPKNRYSLEEQPLEGQPSAEVEQQASALAGSSPAEVPEQPEQPEQPGSGQGSGPDLAGSGPDSSNQQSTAIESIKAAGIQRQMEYRAKQKQSPAIDQNQPEPTITTNESDYVESQPKAEPLAAWAGLPVESLADGDVLIDSDGSRGFIEVTTSRNGDVEMTLNFEDGGWVNVYDAECLRGWSMAPVDQTTATVDE